MKRSILLFATLLFNCFSTSVLYAQTERIEVNLNWFEKDVLIDPQNNIYQKVYSFNNGKLNSNNPEVSSWQAEIKVSGNTKLKVSIENIVLEENIYPVDLKGVNTDFQISTYVNKERDNFIGGVRLTPIRSHNGKVERIKSCILLITHSPIYSASYRGPIRTKTSILSSGEIYKIGIPSEGAYKLTKSDLSNLGINTDNIDPRNISIYSNYGGILPELIKSQNPDDLFELPILIDGESDGKFDANDAIYFYAEGASKWKRQISQYKYETNIYDLKNYVFLKVNNSIGQRIKQMASDVVAEFTSDSYDDLQILEDEKYNLLGLNASTEGSGKIWFGEKMKNNDILDLAKNFDLTNLAINSVTVNGRFASRSESSSTTVLNAGGSTLNTNYNRVSTGSVESLFANLKSFSLSADLSLNKSLSLKYTASSDGEGWLDYITVESQKLIKSGNSPIILRDKRDTNYNTFGYNIQGIDLSSEIWDVTDISNIVSYDPVIGKLAYNTDGLNHKIVVFNKSSTKKPELVGKIDNQNVHEIDNVDMVVLYPSIFKEAADKFIEHRSEHSGLEIIGVDVSKIFPEFSSGRQDPSAIRDFAKMILDRNTRFKYMLMIGDGTYDQRGILSTLPDHRFIPVYETDESLDPIRAFPTDDYYALLSDNEGLGLDGALDLAVGRLTVTTLAEANAVINKIIQYDSSPQRFGDWRLRATFAADDEDSNTHLNQMDDIAKKVVRDFTIINDQKVYYDAYRQETTPGGQRYPEVEAVFKRNMERGHLTFCYLGHGGPKGWSQERVLKVSDIQEWNNINNQTLIVSATCSFTGYDDPQVKSAGEYALLNPKGGTVALFTTVRAVYASENKRLTEAVFDNIYKKDGNGYPMTFGEAITIAKNSNSQDTTGENSRKFSLIGDPSQRIALPFYNITVDEINDQNSNLFTDTIGALDVVKIKGRVVDHTGNLVNDFNGTIFPTIFDKRTIIETLGNDSGSKVTKVDVMKNVIFKGKASITNGSYEFSFVVPKDINYSVGKGKISLYATDDITDAGGAFSDMLIGGSGNNVADDNGPQIDLFINDESFQYGSTVPSTSTLLVNLKDDLGINVTGTSIGHDLTANLEGPLNENYVLNEFYEASLDDYKSGVVKFPLDDLPVGKYTLTVKAWDISNNSSEQKTEFIVVDNDDKLLFNVLNYPNPFSTYTEFGFSHDLGATDAQISIKIFTVTGKLVKSISEDMFINEGRQIVSAWNATDDFGSKLAKGIYLYKINLYSPSLGISRESKFQKLVKI